MAFTARTETYFNASSLSSPYDATVNKPTGTTQGDILFAVICWYASGVTIDSEPTGWTKLADYTANTDRYALYCKIAGDSEPSSYTWSFTASAKVRIVCSCYTGGDFNPSEPIDVVSNTAYRTSNASVIAASMTVSAANSPLVFWASLYRTSSTTYTKPSVPTTDWVEDDDSWNTDPDFANEVCSMIWAGSGATGDLTATASASVTAKHAFAVALKPAPQVKTASATMSGKGYLAAIARRTTTAAATMSGVGSLQCSATKLGSTYYASATMSGAGSLAAAAHITKHAAATMSGAGSLAAAARLILAARATLSGTGSLTAKAGLITPASATISGAGSLSATARLYKMASATISGEGSLSATATVIPTPVIVYASATFSGRGYIAVHAIVFAGITPTLLATQKSASSIPYIEVDIRDFEQGIKRLSWTRLYTGSESNNHHGIAFDGQGSMHRIRAATDNKLYYQKITDPGPNSDYSSWTEIASDCQGPCAIAAQGAKIYIFYRKTDNTLRKYYSHDYGDNWTNAELAAYANVTHLAACWWGTGNDVVCFALKSGAPAKINGIVLNTQDQGTEQNEWSDGAHEIIETLGIGATYDPSNVQCQLVIAGKQSASPYNHYDLFRTWFSALHNFGALESFLMAPQGEDITYQFPDCHLPANKHSYETTRILAVEKFTGTTAFTRAITSHMVKGTDWSSTTFIEPRPFLDITPTYGMRMSSTPDHWWLSTPSGVWRAPRAAGEPLTITTESKNGRILALTALAGLEPPSGPALTLVLDNSTGRYATPGQGKLAVLLPRSEVELKLGYRTANGPETLTTGLFWIDGWQWSSSPNQSLFTIYCLDGWGLMQRWTARYQMRWNKSTIDPKTVWQILYRLLARAGLRLTNSPPKPQSNAINNFQPDFTIEPGQRGTTAISRLLALVPDCLVMRGSEPYTKNPIPTEQSSYSYGRSPGQHGILTAHYQHAVTTPRAQAIGRDAQGTRILAEASDQYALDIGIDILSQDYDPNLQTATRAQERADAILRKHALQYKGGQITAKPNLTQQPLDVITITDHRCGINQQKFRVLAIHTHYDRNKGRFNQRLTLCAP